MGPLVVAFHRLVPLRSWLRVRSMCLLARGGRDQCILENRMVEKGNIANGILEDGIVDSEILDNDIFENDIIDKGMEDKDIVERSIRAGHASAPDSWVARRHRPPKTICSSLEACPAPSSTLPSISFHHAGPCCRAGMCSGDFQPGRDRRWARMDLAGWKRIVRQCRSPAEIGRAHV